MAVGGKVFRQFFPESSPATTDRSLVRGAVCILLAVCLFAPLGAWLYSTFAMSAEERARLAEQFVEPERCRPEPGERRAFLAGVAVLPAAIFGFSLVLAGRPDRWPRLITAAEWALEMGLCVLLAVLGWAAIRAETYYPLLTRYLFCERPLLAIGLFAVSLAALFGSGRRQRLIAAGGQLLALAMVAVVFLTNLFDEKWFYAGSLHYNAVFDSIVQVHRGKALLVEGTNQYGLYAHFLQPIFALIGLSVLKFTAVMGLLTAAGYLALWTVLRQATQNPALALLAFLALLFNHWFCFMVKMLPMELYFQYMPVRFLFPALVVLLAWRHGQHPTRFLYWGTMLLLSAGLLWNLDSGVPAFLSWLGFLCYGELFKPGWRRRLGRCLAHILAALLAAAASVLAYAVLIRLGYGAWPDFRQALVAQQLYYVAGYYMLPMNLPGLWMLVVLIYLAGLTYSAFALVQDRDTPRARLVFLLSILGLGLFSYFQGRSHVRLLARVSWPVFLLLALFLDDLLAQLRARSRRPLPWVLTAVVVWFLAGSAWSLVPQLHYAGRTIRRNLTLAWTGEPTAVQHDAAVLKAAIPPDQPLLVISTRDALLHLLAERPSVLPCPLCQVITLADFHRLRDLLAERPEVPIYIDRVIFELRPWHNDNAGKRLLVAMLRKDYEPVVTTVDGYLFRRRINPMPGTKP